MQDGSTLQEFEKIVDSFLLHGADINAIDLLGNTPLFWVAQTGNIQCVLALLKRGADPNIQNSIQERAENFCEDPQVSRLLFAYRERTLLSSLSSGRPLPQNRSRL